MTIKKLLVATMTAMMLTVTAIAAFHGAGIGPVERGPNLLASLHWVD